MHKLEGYQDIYDDPLRLPDDVVLYGVWLRFHRLISGGCYSFNIVHNKFDRSCQDSTHIWYHVGVHYLG